MAASASPLLNNALLDATAAPESANMRGTRCRFSFLLDKQLNTPPSARERLAFMRS